MRNGAIHHQGAAEDDRAALVGVNSGKRERAGAGLGQPARSGKGRGDADIEAVGVENRSIAADGDLARIETEDEIVGIAGSPQGSPRSN